MKKPQLLEIYEDEMYWIRPSRKARIKLLKRRIVSIIRKILNLSAIPMLVCFLYLASTERPIVEDIKITKMTLEQQLDYYHAQSKKAGS